MKTSDNRIQLSATGRPLPISVRARVMQLLAYGRSPTEISRQLLISRSTVYRYIQAAQIQNVEVPQPKPARGFRYSLLNREILRKLGDLVAHHPKYTLQELKEESIKQGILIKPLPSDSTLYKALHKIGLK